MLTENCKSVCALPEYSVNPLKDTLLILWYVLKEIAANKIAVLTCITSHFQPASSNTTGKAWKRLSTWMHSTTHYDN